MTSFYRLDPDGCSTEGAGGWMAIHEVSCVPYWWFGCGLGLASSRCAGSRAWKALERLEVFCQGFVLVGASGSGRCCLAWLRACLRKKKGLKMAAQKGGMALVVGQGWKRKAEGSWFRKAPEVNHVFAQNSQKNCEVSAKILGFSEDMSTLCQHSPPFVENWVLRHPKKTMG